MKWWIALKTTALRHETNWKNKNLLFWFASTYKKETLFLQMVQKRIWNWLLCNHCKQSPHIIDYKHEPGFLAQPNNNSQTVYYISGFLEIFNFIYDIKTAKMTLFPPRRKTISTFCMNKEALLTCKDEILAPAAALAYGGKDEFKAGKHC